MISKSKIWWKAYFWLMVALLAVAVYYDHRFANALEVVDIIEYGAWLFSLIGLFGFAFSKIIMNKRVWQIWLPIVLVWEVALVATGYYVQDSMESELWFLVLFGLIAGILIIPQYLAIYFYGYRSDALWLQQEAS